MNKSILENYVQYCFVRENFQERALMSQNLYLMNAFLMVMTCVVFYFSVLNTVSSDHINS